MAADNTVTMAADNTVIMTADNTVIMAADSKSLWQQIIFTMATDNSHYGSR